MIIGMLSCQGFNVNNVLYIFNMTQLSQDT